MPGDFMTVQFACCKSEKDPEKLGTNVWILKTKKEVKQFLLSRARSFRVVYGFVSLVDIGTLCEMLRLEELSKSKESVMLGKRNGAGPKCLIYRRGLQHRALFSWGRVRFEIVDSQPLLNGFGLRKLALCGKQIGLPKLEKPKWLGEREPKGQSEVEAFESYAARDASITCRIVSWLIHQHNCDPVEISTSGTLAGREFIFPKRLSTDESGRHVQVPLVEQLIHDWDFSGRSEAFMTGYTPSVYYNDISSQYPVSIAAVKGLLVDRVEDIPENDYDSYVKAIPDALQLTKELDGGPPLFGWIKGSFYVSPKESDLWGLPVQGRTRNYYMTGHISGTYNTFDLCAAKAEVRSVEQIWRPVYGGPNTTGHEKFCKMLNEKLGKNGPPDLPKEAYELLKQKAKCTLNGATGKLVQSHPVVVATTNFPAHSLLIGFSHLLLSKLFDMYGGTICGCDTDSIFGLRDFSGHKFDVGNGEESFPVMLSIKGYGDLSLFRSKMYIHWNPNAAEEFGLNPAYAAHGWDYCVEDFIDLLDGKIQRLDTRMDVKHTLLTRQEAAQSIPFGRWYSEKRSLGLADLQRLLKADLKRDRDSYDSYSLVGQQKNQPSNAWNLDSYFAASNEDDFLELRNPPPRKEFD
jgi:hypothetical protein